MKFHQALFSILLVANAGPIIAESSYSTTGAAGSAGAGAGAAGSVYTAQGAGAGSGYTAQDASSPTQTVSAGAAPLPPPPRHHHKKHHDKFTIAIRIPEAMPVPVPVPTTAVGPIYIGKRHRPDLLWVGMGQNDPLPKHIVEGGYQPRPPATLYVCRANYRGGSHPGKLFSGACNFSWGGQEIVSSQYEVLTSKRILHWVYASFGQIPSGAIEGGHQFDGPLYICQARYRGGMHPGKVYGDACLIGWGGREIAIPEYYVLTM